MLAETPSTPIESARPLALALAMLAIVGVSALAGCSQDEPWQRDEPEEALKVFLQALEYRQLDVAWEFLLPEDRAVLEAQAEALDALAPGVERPPWTLLSPGHVVSSPTEYAAVRVDAEASSDERTVVELVLHDERVVPVTMVRQDGRWYVDLPLESVAAPAAQQPETTNETPGDPQQ